MKTFHDKTGAAWDIALNVGSLRRAASRSGVSLLGAANGAGKDSGERAWFESLPTLTTDIEAFSNAMWAFVEPQATARGISRDEFEERMDGDAIRAANDALEEEILLFSHPALRGLMAKWREEHADQSGSPNSPASSASAPES